MFYFEKVLEGTMRNLTAKSTSLKICPLYFDTFLYTTVANQQKF
jgi:hypothetical protein